MVTATGLACRCCCGCVGNCDQRASNPAPSIAAPCAKENGCAAAGAEGMAGSPPKRSSMPNKSDAGDDCATGAGPGAGESKPSPNKSAPPNKSLDDVGGGAETSSSSGAGSIGELETAKPLLAPP
mmetsp:Transcript_96587/g.268589  ORF Transcript_96587/g.268589 Transcript_96587/m.268589 type:complete len:125 (-) Transcript_96587:468-842(-)